MARARTAAMAAVAALAPLLAACAGDLAPADSAESHRPSPDQDPVVAAAGRTRVPAEVVFVPEVPPALVPVPEEVSSPDALEVGEEFLPPVPFPEEWAAVEGDVPDFAPEPFPEDPAADGCEAEARWRTAGPPSPEPAVQVVEIRTYEVEEVPVETVVWMGTPILYVRGTAAESCGRFPAALPAPPVAPCDPVVVAVDVDPPASRPVAARPSGPRPGRTGGHPVARPPREERPPRREDPPDPPRRSFTVQLDSVPAAPLQRPTLESYAGVRAGGGAAADPDPAPPAPEPRRDRVRHEVPPTAPVADPRPARPRDEATREERREQRQEQRQESRRESREDGDRGGHGRGGRDRDEPARAASIRPAEPPPPPPPPAEGHRGGKRR